MEEMEATDYDDIEEQIQEQFQFHPTSTPRGLSFYDGLVLNSRQQRELNNLKVQTIRDNNKYLAKHPEVRALIAIFLNYLLGRPSHITSVTREAAKFFNRSRIDIEQEIEEYLSERSYLRRESVSSDESIISQSETLITNPELQRPFPYIDYTDEYVTPEYSYLEEDTCAPEFESLVVSTSISDSERDVGDILHLLVNTAIEQSLSKGAASGHSSTRASWSYDDKAIASFISNTLYDNVFESDPFLEKAVSEEDMNTEIDENVFGG